MILKRLRIKNFRSLRDAEIELTPQTAIIGANGCGKSSLLRAIDRFYSSTSSVELDDFFERRVHEPIEIALTFTGFTNEEKEVFNSRIQNHEMTVVRVFDAGGGRSNGKYYGMTLQHAPFAAIRASTGAIDKKSLYNEIRQSSNAYSSLPQVKKADEIDASLAQWEEAHPDALALLRDDGQFFGFSNVARGNLQRSTSFVFIPAVKDAALDAVDAKGAAIARLMELVVRSAIQRRQEVRDLEADVATKYKELIDPKKLPELGTLSEDLTDTLQEFYSDAAVLLEWQPPEDLTLPMPSAKVLLKEAGFDGPVDRKGHGLQRAFIFTLLQHLGLAAAAQASTPSGAAEFSGQAETTKLASTESTAHAEQAAAGGDVSQIIPQPAQTDELCEAEAKQPYVLPGLILAIEEPELYQHPTKQRHFSKVLTKLSNGGLPGVATATQVIFASHSSLFVSMDRFDEVRLARREPSESGGSECKLFASNLAAVARRLEAAYNKTQGSFTAETLRARLHIIGPELAEGFFADLVVLVEGASDLAALLAASALEDADFEANGIAVLSAGGKTNEDRPAAIFTELGIPTYLVFDCDKRPSGAIDGLKQNKALQILMSAAETYDAKTEVFANFASFEVNLETTLASEIGEDVFNSHISRVSIEYGMSGRDDVTKAPFAMREVLKGAAQDGCRSPTLARIVRAIMEKRQAIAIGETEVTELDAKEEAAGEGRVVLMEA